MLGVKSVGEGVHTEVERRSRTSLATKVASLTSRAGIDAQKQLFGQLPTHARCSTTMDNGTEMRLHAELREEYGMAT